MVKIIVVILVLGLFCAGCTTLESETRTSTLVTEEEFIVTGD